MAGKEDRNTGSMRVFSDANKSLRQGIQACFDDLKRIGLPEEEIYNYILRESASRADEVCHRQCRII